MKMRGSRESSLSTRSFACAGAFLLAVGAPFGVLAQVPPAKRDLTAISLEDLMNIQVDTVSRKKESISRVAAAVYVIGAEDIHRSGATNIPDLLRMAPGVNVARIDAHTWAISIRGFNERFSRSVLVLIDGRTVYSPLTGGVNWDQQNVPLEDIERIEVIRGPGGTVWGANAVNGVINILTKSTFDTKGGLIRAEGGTGQSGALAQYGGSLGPKGAYRISENYTAGDDATRADGGEGADGWHTFHTGLRSDWTQSPRDSLMVRGDITEIRGGQTIGNVLSTNVQPDHLHDTRVVSHTADILGRWTRSLAGGSDISLQVYYDRYNRLDGGLREIRNTIDVDFHQHFKAGSRHDVVWGLAYRNTRDNLDGAGTGYLITYNPPRQSDNLFSVFLQDEILLTDSLSLTVGSKLEHNRYTGVEYEPSAQLAWRPTGGQEVWVSLARAIRQPTRTDVGLRVSDPFVLPDGSAAVVSLQGNPESARARLIDFEIGYRTQINKKISIDIATFLSHYNGLLTVEPDGPIAPSPASAVLVIPEEFENLAHARSYGGEVAGTWNVTNRWKISPGYSMTHIMLALDPASNDITARRLPDATPIHQFQVRSQLNLARNIEWDCSLYLVSALRGAAPVPAHNRLDMRLARRIGDSGEISAVGQNLFTAGHAEFFDAEGLLHTQVARSVFGEFTWRF